MTISYISTGALATGTVSITPAYPASAANGDLIVMTVVSGHPTDSIPFEPAGWNLIGTFSGGGGTFGSGTGPRRITLYTQIYNSAATTPPTITIPAGTGATIAGRMSCLRRSAGTGWRYAPTFGEVTTASTTWSSLTSDPLTYVAGDFVLLGYGVRSNVPTLSAETIAAAGVTFGTITEQADDSVATGNLERLVIATGAVTTGTGTTQISPTVGATLTAAHTGVVSALRFRESTTTIVASVQTTNPPRNQVVINNLLSEEISLVSISRVVGNVTTELRGAVAIDTTGQNAIVRVDGEMPFGAAVSYQATLVDALGDTWTITSNSVSSNITNEILSDATTGLGVGCQIVSWHERRYVRESSEFNVSGRIVVVSGPQPSASSTIVLFTRTTAERNSMLTLLATATNGTVQIRTHATTICMDDPGYDPRAQVDSYLQIKSTVLERAAKFRYPQRLWELEVVETEPWPVTIEARGYTLGDMKAYYSGRSLQALNDQFTPGTMLDLALFSWTV